MKSGYLSIILHAHLPFIRYPQYEEFVEERWLFEAVIESYLPLLQKLVLLVDEGIPFKLTIAISPTLSHMLCDKLLVSRTIRHLERLEHLSKMEISRNSGNLRVQHLARFYHKKFREIKNFSERWSFDILGILSTLEEKGNLELMAGTATHAYLPLIAMYPEMVRAQIKIGVNEHIKIFGKAPRGMWLPECGYYPGVEKELAENGIHYLVLDTHCILKASSRPRFGIYAPVYTPVGVAVFGRDPECSRQVWSAESGYPADQWYREFYRDIGFEISPEHLGPLAHPDGIKLPVGIKYYRITHHHGPGNKDFYNPQKARERAAEHAGHFILGRKQKAAQLGKNIPRPPIFVAPYDAELFGHWWFEGPDFLDSLIRKIHYDQEQIETITLSNYLETYPENQIAIPSAGSWGKNGYNEIWLSPSNAWMWRHIHMACEKLIEISRKYKESRGILRRAVEQAARECLLAQSSDWGFMINGKDCEKFATHEFLTHIEYFNRLVECIESGHIEENFLSDLEEKDNIFPDIDISIFTGGLNGRNSKEN